MPRRKNPQIDVFPQRVKNPVEAGDGSSEGALLKGIQALQAGSIGKYVDVFSCCFINAPDGEFAIAGVLLTCPDELAQKIADKLRAVADELLRSHGFVPGEKQRRTHPRCN